MRRLILRTEIEFTSPMRIGSSKEDISDSPILRNEDGLPYIPGTTWAGILRSAAYELSHQQHFLKAWFGSTDDENADNGNPSKILTNDSIILWNESTNVISVAIRDGVAIDANRGVAVENKKFDYEVLPVGVKFPFELELHLSGVESSEEIVLFFRLLKEFQEKRLQIGSKTSRGFGHFQTNQPWRVWDFAFEGNSLLAYRSWLRWSLDETALEMMEFQTPEDIADRLFSVKMHYYPELLLSRDELSITVNIKVDGSLLVRSISLDPETDSIQLKQVAVLENKELPVLPGSSIAGVLRARAHRIVRTVHGEHNSGLVNLLFGNADSDKNTASRVRVDDCCLTEGTEMIHTRVRIDHFTGGAMENYLFTEAPTYRGHGELKLGLRLAGLEEDSIQDGIALMLLIFKDLWSGDLHFGGEAGIGRGRLHVTDAKIQLMLNKSTQEWSLSRQSFSSEGRISDMESFRMEGNPDELEAYVQHFAKEVAL